MKADRLVSTLLLLQARGTVTASEVANELEVSTRTARRDLEALALAGVPVYSRSGRGGGWSLVGGARTDLTGLKSPEARALFLAAGSAIAATPELGNALRKLTQALPEPFRDEAATAVEAIIVDPATWTGPTRPPQPRPQHLDILEIAVTRRQQIQLGYSTPGKPPSVRDVQPLGLVSKAAIWYLVGETDAGRRTFRLDRIDTVELSDRRFDRPTDFDLHRTWEGIKAHYGEVTDRAFTGLALAEPALLSSLRRSGVRFRVADAEWANGSAGDGPTVRSTPVQIEVHGQSCEILARQLAGFVGGLTVTEPLELRRSLGRLGADLTIEYGAESRAERGR